MARVRSERAASVTSGIARHKQAERKKASYKVVYEEISRKKKLQTFLSTCKIPPRGYTFIPAGDTQLTKRCKTYAKQSEVTVYIVSTSTNPGVELSKQVHRIGYHFPTFVVDEACQSLGVTLNNSGRVVQSQFAYLQDDELHESARQRHSAPKKSKRRVQRPSARLDTSLPQAVIDSQAREAIQDLFPKIPPRDLHEIVSRAFDKNKKLVGTAEDTPLVLRANLAVVAHIRHVYTNYDQLLKVGIVRSDARRGIEQFTLNKLVSWRGDDDDDDDSMIEEALREVVVISDDEDSDEEDTLVIHRPSTRDSSLGDFPVDALQATAVDPTVLDDDDESDDEGTGPYRGPFRPIAKTATTYDHEREARMGHERHSRWEQAINRHRHDPVPADNREVYNINVEEANKHYSSSSTWSPRPKPIPGLDNYNRTIKDKNHILGLSLDKDAKVPFAGPIAPDGDRSREQASMTHNRSAQQAHQRSGAIIPVPTQYVNGHGPEIKEHDNNPRFVVTPQAHHRVQRLQPSQPAHSISQSVMPSIESDNFDRRFAVQDQQGVADTIIDLEGENAHVPKRRRFDEVHRPGRQGLETHGSDDRRRTVLIPLDGPRRGQTLHSYPAGPLYEVSNQERVPSSLQSVDHFRGGQRQMRLPDSQKSAQQSLRPVEIQTNSVSSDRAPSTSTYPPQPPFHSSSLRSPRLVRLSDVSDSHAPANDVQSASGNDGTMSESLLPLHSMNHPGMRSQFRQMSISEEGKNRQHPNSNGRGMHALSLHEDRGFSHGNPQHVPLRSSAEEQKRPPRLIRLGQQENTQNHTLLQRQTAGPSVQPNPAFISPRQVMLSQANPFHRGPQTNDPDGRCISHDPVSSRSLTNSSFTRYSAYDLQYQSPRVDKPTALDHYDPRVPNSTLLQNKPSQVDTRGLKEVIILDG